MGFNMKGAPDYDMWLLRGSGCFDEQDEAVGEFEFNTKLRGGTVKVQFTSEREQEYDEDGPCGSCLSIDIKWVNWTFHPDAEVDLDDTERWELEDEAREIAENN